MPAGRSLGPEHVQPGDVVLVSGTIADHGMAVMLARGDLALEADIRSDTAPVGQLVDALLDAAPGTRWLRDPTRGGVGTVANELARDCNLAVVLDETAAAGRPGGQRRLRPARDRSALRRQRGQGGRGGAGRRGRCRRWPPCGRTRSAPRATRIGEIAADPPGIVVLLTTFGGTRIVDMLVGDPLPRIC